MRASEEGFPGEGAPKALQVRGLRVAFQGLRSRFPLHGPFKVFERHVVAQGLHGCLLFKGLPKALDFGQARVLLLRGFLLQGTFQGLDRLDRRVLRRSDGVYSFRQPRKAVGNVGGRFQLFVEVVHTTLQREDVLLGRVDDLVHLEQILVGPCHCLLHAFKRAWEVF